MVSVFDAPVLEKRTTRLTPLPAGCVRSSSTAPPTLTPAAHTSKGQRTLITGSALALDKKGA